MRACPFCAKDIQGAALVCEHCNWQLDEQPTAVGPTWLRGSAVTVGAVLLLTFIGALTSPLLRAKAPQPTSKVSATVPMALTDVVENLPANSWKAVPLNVPHDGVVEVEVGVAHGNPVNVFVTTPADLQQMHGDDVMTVRRHPGFDVALTKQLVRQGQLTAGNYYLVLQDPSMSSRLAPASDVSIQASLRR